MNGDTTGAATIPGPLTSGYSRQKLRRDLKLARHWTRPKYPDALKAVLSLSHYVSLVILIFASLPGLFPSEPVWTYRWVFGAAACVAFPILVLLWIDLVAYHPKFHAYFSKKKSKGVFKKIAKDMPDARLRIFEARTQPATTHRAVSRNTEKLLSTMRELLPLRLCYSLAALRVLWRIGLIVIVLSALCMFLNLATGHAVVSNANSGDALFSLHFGDYFIFGFNFLLSASSPYVVSNGSWGLIYTLLNGTSLLAIGSFILVNINTVMAGSDTLLAVACSRFVRRTAQLQCDLPTPFAPPPRADQPSLPNS